VSKDNSATDHPVSGDDTDSAACHTQAQNASHQLRGIAVRTYEITFSGQAGRTLRAQFDDCKVTTGPDSTTLCAELPDQAALSGLVLRIIGLGLEVIRVYRVPPPNG
jgi:hypothetical protein